MLVIRTMASKTSKHYGKSDEIAVKEKNAISKLEKETIERCPELIKYKPCFYYCAQEKTATDSIQSKPYCPRRLGILELKVYCMAKANSCRIYLDSQKNKAEN